MTSWIVIFTPEAEQEFNALPMDVRAHGAWIIELLESMGPGTGPGTLRQASGREIVGNAPARSGWRIARALYFAHVGRRLCVVRVFMKKTQKTPRREIELALSRIAQVERDEDV